MGVLEVVKLIDNESRHKNLTKFSALEYAAIGDSSKRVIVDSCRAIIGKVFDREQLLKEIEFHKKVVEYGEFSLLNSDSNDDIKTTKRAGKIFLRFLLDRLRLLLN